MPYTISTDKNLLDIALIHRFLSQSSYWAKDIPYQTVAKSVEHSLCFGVYLPTGEQVGFARVVSDFATVAYLGDVFILPEHRGQGLSKQLMTYISAYPALQQLRRWFLRTADAHSLYAQYGFVATPNPERWMEKYNPDVYRLT